MIKNGRLALTGNSQAQQTSVPPDVDTKRNFPPNAFCDHSKMGGVTTAPVTANVRSPSKEPIFTKLNR